MTPEERDSYKVDRTGWAPGPWDGEPDRVDWEHRGLPCFVIRHPEMGNWAGYVGVPPEHPRYGKEPDGLRARAAICYTNKCSGMLCHVPQPGQSDDIWWFGFDFGHAWDRMPGTEALLTSLGYEGLLNVGSEWCMPTYKTLHYACDAVNELAAQLAGDQ